MRKVFHELLKSRLVHYELFHYAPSTVAAAALCLCQQFLPSSQISVEPLGWLVDGQEMLDIQRCFLEMSIWHSTTMTSPIPASSSKMMMNSVDIFDDFANFSIAHPQ